MDLNDVVGRKMKATHSEKERNREFLSVAEDSLKESCIVFSIGVNACGVRQMKGVPHTQPTHKSYKQTTQKVTTLDNRSM